MSVQGPLPAYPLNQPAYAQMPPLGTMNASAYQPPAINAGLQFDLFQSLSAKPAVLVNNTDQLTNSLLHPFQLKKARQAQTPESPLATLKMYKAVKRELEPGLQDALQDLWEKGILTGGKTEDGHSALYQLYAMLTTPRATGYDNRRLLNETVNVLSRPYTISQRFAPLSPNAAQRLLQTRYTPGLSRVQVAPPIKPIQPTDLNVESSATCVASSVMYYMAEKEPAELARQLNELTSPMNAFFEKARFDEISPDDPAQAPAILNEQNVPFFISGDNELTIKVENPPAGVIRAVDSQKVPIGGQQYRDGIAAAYQSAITFLATRSYDPATDMRDSDDPQETSKGITEAEKTKIETIIKDNGGTQSVTYQGVANKENPAPGEEGNSYLYGYNRRFEQTTNDILNALKMKEPVIIGTTDTDETGAIVAGHEITITGAFVDKKDQQLKFVVADSDDNVAAPVVKSAKELIPTIHHAGLPLRLARKVNQQISANNGYFVPDQQDEANFKTLAYDPNVTPVAEEPSLPQAPAIGQPVNPFQTYTPVAQPVPYPVPNMTNGPFSPYATQNPFTSPTPLVSPLSA